MSDEIAHIREWFLQCLNAPDVDATIRVHEADDVDEKSLIEWFKARPTTDSHQVCAGCWAVGGGIDNAIRSNPFTDEQTVGFEIEKLCRQNFHPNAPIVIRINPKSIWNCDDVVIQMNEWLEAANVEQIKHSDLKNGDILLYGLIVKSRRIPDRPLTLGLVFAENKLASFANPMFYECAQREGMTIALPSPDRTVTQAVDVVLLKNRDLTVPEFWRTATIIDNPEDIRILNNRSTVDSVCKKAVSNIKGVFVPRIFTLKDADKKYPLLAKPGDANQHRGIWFISDEHALMTFVSRAEPSDLWILQECIDHAGVVFKTSVVGNKVFLARRFSAVNETSGGLVELGRRGDVHPRKAKYKEQPKDNSHIRGIPDVGDEFPPIMLIMDLANALREHLNLSFFGFDVVVERKTKRVFLVDVNYFPSFVDVPNRETLVLRCVRNIAEAK